jgi:hypothetical protein
MNRQSDLLLLTATVSPRPDQPSLALVNPAERFEEYRNAMAHYVKLLNMGAISGILFAENSGYDLTRFAALFPLARIEWLSIDPEVIPSGFHRGYAEFQLIDAALARSQLFQCMSPDVRIWKVSGRYIVRNLRRVVRLAPRRFDLYGSIGGGWFEMSILAWSPRAHQQLIQGSWKHFASAEAPELILYRLLQSRRDPSLHIVCSFVWSPVIEGRRGTDGSPFQGRRTRYRFMLISCGKLLCLPWRWLIQSRRRDLVCRHT